MKRNGVRPPKQRTGCIVRMTRGVAIGLVCVVQGLAVPPHGAAQSPQDSAAIRAVLAALPAAWNSRDASAWAAEYAENSTFTNILGMNFPDRAANEARHATLFATIFRNSHLASQPLAIRFTGPDAAVAEAALRLTGYDALPPGIQETEPGVLETRLVSVLQRIGGRWRIIVSQNTAISPAARERPGDP